MYREREGGGGRPGKRKREGERDRQGGREGDGEIKLGQYSKEGERVREVAFCTVAKWDLLGFICGVRHVSACCSLLLVTCHFLPTYQSD